MAVFILTLIIKKSIIYRRSVISCLDVAFMIILLYIAFVTVYTESVYICRCGGIGRHKGLKI